MSREVTVTVRHFLQEVQQQSCFPSYFGTLRSFRRVSVSQKTLRARNTKCRSLRRNLSPLWSLRQIGTMRQLHCTAFQMFFWNTHAEGGFNRCWQSPATNFSWILTLKAKHGNAFNFWVKTTFRCFSLWRPAAQSRILIDLAPCEHGMNCQHSCLGNFLNQLLLTSLLQTAWRKHSEGCQAKFRRFCSCPLTSIDDLGRGWGGLLVSSAKHCL